jgi:L-fucono-1,5-lactonase
MIDAHVHVWTLEPDRYPWNQTLPHVPIPSAQATVEELLKQMRAANVGHAVLVQPSVYGWDNSYLCDCLNRYPGLFAGVCLVDPHSMRAGEDLRHWCRDRGCQGVRINLIADDDVGWILGTAQQGLWDAAAELAVPVALQMRPHHAGTVSALAARRPELRFIVDYLGPESFHDGTGVQAVQLLASCENIFFKLLAVGQDSRETFPFRDLWALYRAMIASAGGDRIVFGSDSPHVQQACRYEQAMTLPAALPFVDAATRRNMEEITARKLWRFDAEARDEG